QHPASEWSYLCSRDHPPAAVAVPDSAHRIILACKEASLARQPRAALELSLLRVVQDLAREIILGVRGAHTADRQRATLPPADRVVTTRGFFIPVRKKK